ncbi:MAG: hypothetical protein OXC83_09320 [Chloroflexi bacterium]|nr:hypothetical protein [Chloroflexota bacterium]
MAYTFCDYMLGALNDLRQYEDDPATKQALFAAIHAFVDEHRRHSRLTPNLETRVIDMVLDPDDEEETNSMIAGPCVAMPSPLLAETKRPSEIVANRIMDDLGLDLLKQYAPSSNPAPPPSHLR